MYVRREDILQATDMGLKVFAMYHPEVNRANPEKVKFKIRNENTASAGVFKTKRTASKEWILKDFGSGDSWNCVEYYMEREGMEFSEAIQAMAKQFNVNGSGDKPIRSSTYKSLKPDKKKGITYTIDEDPEKLEEWKHVWGKQVTTEALKRYNVSFLKEYTTRSNGKRHQHQSNEHYPIFLIDTGEFKKIYQPFAEKKWRFMHVGSRPEGFIGGFSQLKKSSVQKTVDSNSFDQNPKRPMAILCSGESDAMNVASLGYDVIWMNSETQILTWKQWNLIRAEVHELYILMDIDSTGLKQAREYGLKFIDAKIIRLPESLKKNLDRRGNPCKDAKDYLEHHTDFQFHQLVESSYPFRFWDQVIKRDPNEGTVKDVKYYFNPIHCINFLEWIGYRKIESKNSKTGYTFIKIDDHIIQEVDHQKIRGFINSFVRDRKLKTDIINLVLKTNQLSENALSNLQEVEIDFSKAGQDHQHFFFEDKVWKITKDAITEVKPDNITNHVWDDQIIKPTNDVKGFKPEIDQPYFKITQDKMENFDIEILDQSNPYFQFIINTSRMYWKEEFNSRDEDPYQTHKELEKSNLHKIDGEGLTDQQIKEQKLHLINKIYTLGYLLHNYKNPSRAWMPFAIDNRITDVTDSHGGSGKSILFDSLKIFLKTAKLNGRNGKLMENNHAFENVNQHTDFIFFDDAKNGFDIGFLFPFITGEMEVNPKHARSFTIPFSESAKLACTSNFTPRQLDSSTERRLLYTVNSDWYHYRSDRNAGSKTPQDDLGMILLRDFDREQWNQFFNLKAQCVQFYLNHGKIEPPMDNVEKRALRGQMGDQFFDWASTHLPEFVNKVDVPVRDEGILINRIEINDRCNAETKINFKSTRFKKCLDAWCKYYGIILNPNQVLGSSGRIVKTIDGKSTEFFFLWKDTSGQSEEEKELESLNEKAEKLPFINKD